MSSELQIKLPTLHSGQTKLLREARRFNAVACGRRFGKTLFAALELAANAVIDGHPVGWFAPNYKYLAEPFRMIDRDLSPIITSKNKSDRRIEFLTGGSVDFWTLEDPDAGRSHKYRLVIIDEAGLVSELDKRWYEAIRPTLSDMQGDAWLLGTPKGRNFFADAYEMGQDPLKLEWASWQMPTSTNPHIAKAEVDAARRELPERSFEQEYLAMFLDEAGGVFRKVRAAIGRERPKATNQCVYIGLDLARTEDFTVICALDDAGRQLEIDRFNQVSWEIQIGRIIAFAKRYPEHVILVDSTGVGDPIFERLRGLGLTVKPYKFNATSKRELIDNLAMMIEQGELNLLDHAQQTNELLAYQYEVTAAGNVRMNAPSGMHDDLVIGLALAAWLIRKPAVNAWDWT